MNTPAFQTPDEALSYLRGLGQKEDKDIDLAEAALALALVFLPGLSVDRYRQHLHLLEAQVQKEHQSRIAASGKDDAHARLEALRKVIHDDNGYQGDDKTYDDIQNTSLIRVIERRRGLPVALGVIYIHLARAQGWSCEGLSFPAHFVLRLEKDGERMIVDPFRQGREMGAAELRDLLKSILGDSAELSHEFYAPVSNRDVLVRLQNNLKKRLIDAEDYAGAITAAETISAFAPNEYRVLLDRGVLHAKLGQNVQARAALESYIAAAQTPKEKSQAAALLAQIPLED